MGLKPLPQTRTGSYFPATYASPCQGSHVTKTGRNILVTLFIYSSYWNVDHVLRIPCREIMHVSIFISGLTTWYVPLFSFNTCSYIYRTQRSSANIGRLWLTSPSCPGSHINATDVSKNFRSQEYDGFHGITPRYFRKGMIRRFVNMKKSNYQQSVELILPTLPPTTAN